MTSVNLGTGVTTIGNNQFYNTDIASIDIPINVTSCGTLFMGKTTGVEIILHRIYETQIIGSSDVSTATVNTTYTLRFLDITVVPSSYSISKMVTNGGSKETITYNIYTDVEDLAKSTQTTGYQYAVFNAYHLDGTLWDFTPEGTYTEGFLTYTNSSKVELISCNTAASGSITVPNTVITIQDNAFANCVNSELVSITIPSSVVNMGNTIFNGIKSSIRINLYSLYGVKLIPDKASTTSSTSSTYNIYFYDISSIPTGWSMRSMLGYGAQKNTITYNIYTDLQTLKNLAVTFGNGNSYTTVNVKHLDGSDW